METQIEVRLKFRVADQKVLSDALKELEIDADLPFAEQVENLVAMLDTLALRRGHELGWLDLGLERIQ